MFPNPTDVGKSRDNPTDVGKSGDNPTDVGKSGGIGNVWVFQVNE